MVTHVQFNILFLTFNYDTLKLHTVHRCFSMRLYSCVQVTGFVIAIAHICNDNRIKSRMKKKLKQKQMSTHILMYMGTSHTMLA
jgi:hypothetical protein